LTGLRLLLLAPSLGFGGGIERVADALERAWDGPFERLDLYRRTLHTMPAGNHWAKGVFSLQALATARRLQPDVVLALHVGLLPIAAVASTLIRADLALIAIGQEVWAPMRAPRRAMIRRCSYVLAISSFTRSWIARRAEIDPECVSVLHLPVDEALAHRAFLTRPPYSLKPNLLTVSRISRDERYKGHFHIADSLPMLLERRPDARWIVAGTGDDLEALRSRCRDLGLGDAVTFLGDVTDAQLANLYASAAAFVLPSVANVAAPVPSGEGFGLVYAEAGAFGVPAIASVAGGGCLDFVVHDRTGLTVPPGDREALAIAMFRLLEDRELRERLGEAARVRVRERHLMPHFAANLNSALALKRRQPAVGR
jgi:phosphatidylinositol alpha-1,6-mannosyltransferase